MAAPGLTGQLLVASPTLQDDNFVRTVVLVVQHDEDGAVGLVLNRPSESPVAAVLPDWAALALPPAVAYVGGPVEPRAALCLGRRTVGDSPHPGFRPVTGGVGLVDLDADPDELGVSAIRLFAGYAGWSSAQLEWEIGLSAWYVVAALDVDALSPAPEGLWRDVLHRQGGHLAFVANFPDDPSMN